MSKYVDYVLNRAHGVPMNALVRYPATEQQVLDLIDEWHSLKTDDPEAEQHLSLHEWLGWSWVEYCAWVERSEIPR